MGTYIKLGASIIILSICAGIYYKKTEIHEANLKVEFDSGYKEAESKCLKEKLDEIEVQRIASENAQSEAVTMISLQLDAITSEKEIWHQKALKLKLINERLKREKIPEIAKVNTCTNRGLGYVELWNQRAEMFRAASGIISQ